jgi:hypothetical protein
MHFLDSDAARTPPWSTHPRLYGLADAITFYLANVKTGLRNLPEWQEALHALSGWLCAFSQGHPSERDALNGETIYRRPEGRRSD